MLKYREILLIFGNLGYRVKISATGGGVTKAGCHHRLVPSGAAKRLFYQLERHHLQKLCLWAATGKISWRESGVAHLRSDEES